jgi:hypothetical protein
MRITSEVPELSNITEIPPFILTFKRPNQLPVNMSVIKIKTYPAVGFNKKLHNSRTLYRQGVTLPVEQTQGRFIRDETEVRNLEKDH